jgi:hypothetical protein
LRERFPALAKEAFSMNEEFTDWPRTIRSRITTGGWTADWRLWFTQRQAPESAPPDRANQIQHHVRLALTELSAIEWAVIEAHYFDGCSLNQIANSLGLSLNRVTTVYRRALSRLEQMLSPFVHITFGLSPTGTLGCPICLAPWRREAEELLDTRTPEVTWGEMIVRIARATGWRASTPQVLISHHRKHRVYRPTDTTTPAHDPNSIFKEDA